jgi:hypothetical protein
LLLVTPVIHLRLPEATRKALLARQEDFKKQGVDVPVTAIIRGLLDEGLGVANGKKNGKKK